MADWRVPLADVRLSEEDVGAVADTLRSGWLSMGPRTQEFETAFADYVGSSNAIATSNGTAALHLMTLAAGLGQGQDMIVPSLTFVATVNCIAYVGARPVFADIASITEPWITAETVEAALTPSTSAIMYMEYAGHPGAGAAVAAFAASRDLAFYEDAAHGVGGGAGGRKLGTLGRAGAFSFFSNKNLAIGEGGMLVSDDDEFAQRARDARSHGMTTLTWDRHRGHAAGYDVIDLGFNYRIDEPRAALALRRLRALDADNALRARVVAAYRERLEGVDGLSIPLPEPAEGSSAHHVFPIVLDARVDRDTFRGRLHERGVQTSLHYPPVHLFSIYRDESVRLPRTEEYSRRAVTLPLFPHMSEMQIELVADSVRAELAAA